MMAAAISSFLSRVDARRCPIRQKSAYGRWQHMADGSDAFDR
jgi:hypothetical protein